jgi:hypothetical protein
MNIKLNMVQHDLGIRPVTKEDRYFEYEDKQVYQWLVDGELFGVKFQMDKHGFYSGKDSYALTRTGSFSPESLIYFDFDKKMINIM